MPSAESIPETAAPPAPPPAETTPLANGEEETSLARMADDGAPTASLSSPDLRTDPVAAPVAIPAADALLPLEVRIRRLEEALAQLQPPRGGDSRIVPQPAGPGQPTATTTALLDVGKRLLGAATHAVTAAPAPSPVSPPSSVGGRALWFLWDAWAEARAIVRLFVDPRYHLPWSARIPPLLLLAAILTSYYWVPGTTIPVLGSWINKMVDLLLAFLLFKWLGHEARRYRQTSPDLPPGLRL